MVHRNEEIETLEKSSRRKVKVKAEFDDDSSRVLFKRPKFHSSLQQEKKGGVEKEGGGVLGYNPLEEPSPIGLKLKKSPSFLDLIQMKLAQDRKRKEKISCGAAGGGDVDNNNNTNNNINKLKASNFPATVLKIGTWEYKSRYEGDLVAKCYFAKHKLVWEVLDGGLKNKIEIQWADIMAINANYPDTQPGSLDVVLSRQPLFYREINPQPRKHTLWQATTDFTSGQASLHRRHFLQFPEGILGKHFQKLIQCDPRLSFLSKQPQIVLDNPYFQQRVSIFDVQRDGKHGFDIKSEGKFSLIGIKDTVSASVSGISSSDIENQNPLGSHLKLSQNDRQSIPEAYVNGEEVSSKFSEAHGLELLNQIKLPGLHSSMSVGDLVSHIGDCISEQMRTDNPSVSVGEAQKWEILEEITQYLLNDNQTSTSSNEKAIMSRVNSLCCLLQKEDTRAQNLPVSAGNVRDLVVGNTLEDFIPTNHSHDNLSAQIVPALVNDIDLGNNSGQGANMSRKDSVGELLLHLPRIASLPQFLIPED